jgi:LEA14-like dessication related protein
MKKSVKYGLIALGLGLTGSAIALGIWAKKQYEKLLKNTTGYKSFSIKEISAKRFAFNVVYTYTNNMDVDVVLTNQVYDIYLNNIYTTTLTNKNMTVLKANATSEIPLDVNFDPKDMLSKLSLNVATFLTDYKKLRIKIVMKLKVKLLFFSIPISYTYEDSLKNMMGLK